MSALERSRRLLISTIGADQRRDLLRDYRAIATTEDLCRLPNKDPVNRWHEVIGNPNPADANIDGEVIAADETGRPVFYELVRRTRRDVSPQPAPDDSPL